MKIKLKPLNKGDKKGHHSNDFTDAVALNRMYPKAAIIERGCQGHLIIGDKDSKVIAVLPPDTNGPPSRRTPKVKSSAVQMRHPPAASGSRRG